MRAYAEELARRLPRIAPDLAFEAIVRTTALDRHEQLNLAWGLRRLHPRLVHHLSVYAPLAGPRPYVITIHDLIHLRFPTYFKRTVGPYYRTVVRWVAAGAARVITDDERTVADLERFLGVPPRKVCVIPLGVDEAYLGELQHADMQQPAPPELTPMDPYFLYAGNRREHKNLDALFRAWTALDPTLTVDLALTGEDDGEFGGASRPRRERGKLRFLGNLHAPELARHYGAAVALVYPSLCEGFGLPMLEAAAVGTPVIASDTAVPGVLRRHVATFAPNDVSALTRLLARALPRQAAAQRDEAQSVAHSLTWDRCAQRTAEVYREVLAETRRR